jgi:hypothetical protein
MNVLVIGKSPETLEKVLAGLRAKGIAALSCLTPSPRLPSSTLPRRYVAIAGLHPASRSPSMRGRTSFAWT